MNSYVTSKSGVRYEFILEGDFLKCTAYKEQEYAKWCAAIDKRSLKETQSVSRCEIEYELSEILVQLQDDNTHYPEEVPEGKPITISITTVVSPTIIFTNHIILDCIDTTPEEKLLYASLVAEKSANDTREEVAKALEKSDLEIREMTQEIEMLKKRVAELERMRPTVNEVLLLQKISKLETNLEMTIPQNLSKLETRFEDIMTNYSGRLGKLEGMVRKPPTFPL